MFWARIIWNSGVLKMFYTYFSGIHVLPLKLTELLRVWRERGQGGRGAGRKQEQERKKERKKEYGDDALMMALRACLSAHNESGCREWQQPSACSDDQRTDRHTDGRTEWLLLLLRARESVCVRLESPVSRLNAIEASTRCARASKLLFSLQ